MNNREKITGRTKRMNREEIKNKAKNERKISVRSSEKDEVIFFRREKIVSIIDEGSGVTIAKLGRRKAQDFYIKERGSNGGAAPSI